MLQLRRSSFWKKFSLHFAIFHVANETVSCPLFSSTNMSQFLISNFFLKKASKNCSSDFLSFCNLFKSLSLSVATSVDVTIAALLSVAFLTKATEYGFENFRKKMRRTLVQWVSAIYFSFRLDEEKQHWSQFLVRFLRHFPLNFFLVLLLKQLPLHSHNGFAMLDLSSYGVGGSVLWFYLKLWDFSNARLIMVRFRQGQIKTCQN